jgi:hypothetical protein
MISGLEFSHALSPTGDTNRPEVLDRLRDGFFSKRK